VFHFSSIVSITVGGIVFPGVLILFDSSNFDIILEMSWLCTYGVKIDCDDPKVILRDEQGREICFLEELLGVLRKKDLIMRLNQSLVLNLSSKPNIVWPQLSLKN